MKRKFRIIVSVLSVAFVLCTSWSIASKAMRFNAACKEQELTVPAIAATENTTTTIAQARTQTIVEKSTTATQVTSATTTALISNVSTSQQITTQETVTQIQIAETVLEELCDTETIDSMITNDTVTQQPTAVITSKQKTIITTTPKPIMTTKLQKTTQKPITTTKLQKTTPKPITTTILKQTSPKPIMTTMTTSEPTTTVTTTTTTIVESMSNAIQLPYSDYPIELVVLPADSQNVDYNDIVLDDGTLFSSPTNRLLFGHVYRSFSRLREIKVGEQITVWTDSIPKTYTVILSVKGALNSGNTDICIEDSELFPEGTSMLYSSTGYDTIRLITCTSVFDNGGRWLVIACDLDNPL